MKKTFKVIIILIILAILGYFIYNGTVSDLIGQISAMAYSNVAGLEEIIKSGDLISDEEASALRENSSELDTSSYSFSTTYYPYYNMLSSTQKHLYKQVYANVMNLSSSLVVSDSLYADDVEEVITAIYNDNPELFWIKNEYSYTYMSNNEVVQIYLYYFFDENSIDTAKSNFNSVANGIIDEASSLSSNYEKEKYVHNYLINLISYNENASMNQSAYSALVNNSTVCAGYARAFQYIMQELGIPTYYVTGYAGGDHAWNIVYLSDGYYNVDLTWDDSASNKYKYFNKSDSEFSKTHTRTDMSKNLPSCNASTYSNLEESSTKTTSSSENKTIIDNNAITTNNSTPEENNTITNTHENIINNQNNNTNQNQDSTIQNTQEDLEIIENRNNITLKEEQGINITQKNEIIGENTNSMET